MRENPRDASGFELARRAVAPGHAKAGDAVFPSPDRIVFAIASGLAVRYSFIQPMSNPASFRSGVVSWTMYVV